MKEKYQHIFFDLDRTLWHFDANSTNVLNEVYNDFELGPNIPSSDSFIKKYQEINEELWALYREDRISKEDLRWKRFAETLAFFGIDNKELGEEMGNYYVHHSPRQTELFPYTREVLEYLADKYTLHIITNGFEEVQDIKLTKSGIDHFFDQLIMSEKVGVKKPHPYIFKKAMALSDAKVEHSLMIGDDLYADIYGAQRVGMDHIYFNFNNAPHDKQVQAEISCLSELLEIL
jgi:putative hydrolase of the HAD superfamily